MINTCPGSDCKPTHNFTKKCVRKSQPLERIRSEVACNSIRRKEVLTSESLARWRGGEKPGVSEREDVLPSNERNRRARFPHPARKDDDSSTRGLRLITSTTSQDRNSRNYAIEIARQANSPARQPEVQNDEDQAQEIIKARDLTENLPEFPITVSPRIKESTPGSSSTFYSADTFESSGVSKALEAALQGIGLHRPSFIQAAAFKAFAEHPGHLLVADHSGSGKTLSYLVPIMQQLRDHEDRHGARIAKPNCPAAIILAPTQELCAQVRAVAKDLSKCGLPCRIKLMTGGLKGKRSQRDSLQEGPDIVIGTPGRLQELFEAKHLRMDRCQTLVMDEVDILRGEASLFRDQVDTLQQAAPSSMRAVLVTASLPEISWMELQGEFPGLKPVLGPGLHRPAPGSLEQLIDCSGGEEINEDTAYHRKATAMLQVIQDQRSTRTIIFCNKISTCQKVENTLKRRLRDSCIPLPYHAGIEGAKRQFHLRKFLESDQEDHIILVSTDRASRGLDSCLVDHVILFDFPRDPSEYLRRAGRTARGASGKGVVSLLVLGRQVKLAKQILARNESGQPLHRIPLG